MLEILCLTMMGIGLGDILQGLLDEDDQDDSDEAADENFDPIVEDIPIDSVFDDAPVDVARDDATIVTTDSTVTVTQAMIDAEDDDDIVSEYVLTEGANLAINIDDDVDGYVHLVHTGYTDAETVDDLDGFTYGVSLDILVVTDSPLSPYLSSISGDAEGYEFDFATDVTVLSVVETYSATQAETGDVPYIESLGGFVQTGSGQIDTFSNQYDPTVDAQYNGATPPKTPWWEAMVSEANTQSTVG
ncbi:hypothetical protein EDD53_1548 [Pacificibacter maritimus]|uniref:Uncharacterized protein n=1 Tax=Pacificibacter maritimus TaxID=762213 RepID=A0A3N4V2J6_9RHOB|nr:hypothetical protein [Pacificibacter maritimus]RPE67144.1 hypothetical protein EDD53_1548 [Pacificibacter maritimus]